MAHEFIEIFRRRIAYLRSRGLEADADEVAKQMRLYKHAAGL